MKLRITRTRIVLPIVMIAVTAASCSTERGGSSETVAATPLPIIQQAMPDSSPNTPAEYREYADLAKEGPIIPGLFQSAVPQGMAYYPDEELMFISNYMSDGRASTVSILSMDDGALVKTVWLENPDGTPHDGHVGGLALSPRHLWIASGKGVYRTPLQTILDLPDNSMLRMGEFIPTAARGSFASSSDGILWIGEFTRHDGSYAVDESHHLRTSSGVLNYGWLAGYLLHPDTDLIQFTARISGQVYPDYILSIPHEVQGVAFFEDLVVLSRSYGRKNDSRLSIFTNPLSEIPPGSTPGPDGTTIPVWVLDRENLLREIVIPPMSEGVVNYHDSAAVLFESASDKYRGTARFPEDRIQILTLPEVR